MAVDMDQQNSFKYFCRICKKGFGCGRALGGHMRAHGIGDEPGYVDDGDTGSDCYDKQGGNAPSGNKCMYALRTNPNRLKRCHSCGNCGKEFSSWKSLFEHGKCISGETEQLASSRGSDEDNDGEGQRGCGGWSKGKRTRRVMLVNSNSYCPSSEEEELANCLVMLSAARVDHPLVAETEESCASAGKEEERQRNYTGIAGIANRQASEKAKATASGMFECKACKKVFSSHQALGGHRASHKKVKGCFATKINGLEESIVEEDVITNDYNLQVPSNTSSFPVHHDSSILPARRKSNVHECSICHRIFASGQALGGHKRCHWITSNSQDGPIAKLNHLQQRFKFSKSEPLDLNLPAPVDDPTGVRQTNHSPLRLQLPTALYLQQCIGITHPNNSTISNNNICSSNISGSSLHVDDEGDSKVKLAKLSELKDMNLGGNSSPWLQVGIGSATDGTSDP